MEQGSGRKEARFKETKKRTDDDREYGKREKGNLHYESQMEPELAPRLRTNPLIHCGYDP